METAPLGAVKAERIVGDFVGATAKGESVGVILFQDDGRLSELEIYPFSDFENKTPDSNFPLIESLKQLKFARRRLRSLSAGKPRLVLSHP